MENRSEYLLYIYDNKKNIMKDKEYSVEIYKMMLGLSNVDNIDKDKCF